VIVIVAAEGPNPFSLSVAGEIEQLEAAGAPAQARDTWRSNPFEGLRASVYVAVCPAGMLDEAGETFNRKSAIVIPSEIEAL